MINVWACGLLALGQIAIAINIVAGKHLIEIISVHTYLCSRYLASTVFLSSFLKRAKA
jgi:hypothetical protein